jgi:DNA-binding NtrC family response regulator
LSAAATERLLRHAWPGNLRELRNVMDQSAVLARHDVVAANEIELVRGRLPNARRARETRTATAPAEAESSEDLSVPPDGSEDVEEVEQVEEVVDSHVETSAVEEVTAPILRSEVTRSSEPQDHPFIVRVAIGTSLAEVERLLILKTIDAASGNKQRAARMLGISRRGLYIRLAAYGEPNRAREPRGAD